MSDFPFHFQWTGNFDDAKAFVGEDREYVLHLIEQDGTYPAGTLTVKTGVTLIIRVNDWLLRDADYRFTVMTDENYRKKYG